MEKIDYKKVNKELYVPTTNPSLIKVPAMNFLMVDGHGNPNDEGGEYHKAVELLYAISYTIKMSNKKSTDTDNFDYVVPPLEGLWWLEDKDDRDFTKKDLYCWTSMIRQPEFVTQEIFNEALIVAKKKNPELDDTKVRLQMFEEGLCVQCMHLGPYVKEDATLAKIEDFIKENGLFNNIGNTSPEGNMLHHHEIYLSDPRKIDPASMKTVLRHPVRY